MNLLEAVVLRRATLDRLRVRQVARACSEEGKKRIRWFRWEDRDRGGEMCDYAETERDVRVCSRAAIHGYTGEVACLIQTEQVGRVTGIPLLCVK